MALTSRTNGSASGNIIQASWFNDFKDLLTGVMTTQPVTIANTLTITGASSLQALTTNGLLTAAAGLSITGGAFSVTGAVTLAALTTNGLLTAAAGLTITSGTLSVTGAATFSSAVTFSNAVSHPNATLVSFLATTGTNGSIYIDATNNLIVHAGNNNKVIITDKTALPILTLDATAAAITMPNATILTFAATTGTSGSMYTDSSNNLNIHAANNNKVVITDKTANPLLTIDAAANLITAAKPITGTTLTTSGNITCNGAVSSQSQIQAFSGIALPVGAITKINQFNGAGSGTYNHGLSSQPIDLIVHLNTTTLCTVSIYSFTTTQCYVNVATGGAGWEVTGWC